MEVDRDVLAQSSGSRALIIRVSGLSASGVVEVFLGVRSSVKRVGACSREKGSGQQNPFQ